MSDATKRLRSKSRTRGLDSLPIGGDGKSGKRAGTCPRRRLLWNLGRAVVVSRAREPGWKSRSACPLSLFWTETSGRWPLENGCGRRYPPGERAPRERVFVSRGNVHLFGNFRAGNERELHSGNPGNGRRYAGRSQESMGATIPEASGCSFPGETCTCSEISRPETSASSILETRVRLALGRAVPGVDGRRDSGREQAFVSRGNVHLFGNFRAGSERELHSGNPGAAGATPGVPGWKQSID